MVLIKCMKTMIDADQNINVNVDLLVVQDEKSEASPKSMNKYHQ